MDKTGFYVVIGSLIFFGLLTVLTGVLFNILHWELHLGFAKFTGDPLLYLGIGLLILGGLLGFLMRNKVKKNN